MLKDINIEKFDLFIEKEYLSSIMEMISDNEKSAFLFNVVEKYKELGISIHDSNGFQKIWNFISCKDIMYFISSKEDSNKEYLIELTNKINDFITLKNKNDLFFSKRDILKFICLDLKINNFINNLISESEFASNIIRYLIATNDLTLFHRYPAFFINYVFSDDLVKPSLLKELFTSIINSEKLNLFDFYLVERVFSKKISAIDEYNFQVAIQKLYESDPKSFIVQLDEIAYFSNNTEYLLSLYDFETSSFNNYIINVLFSYGYDNLHDLAYQSLSFVNDEKYFLYFLNSLTRYFELNISQSTIDSLFKEECRDCCQTSKSHLVNFTIFQIFEKNISGLNNLTDVFHNNSLKSMFFYLLKNDKLKTKFKFFNHYLSNNHSPLLKFNKDELSKIIKLLTFENIEQDVSLLKFINSIDNAQIFFNNLEDIKKQLNYSDYMSLRLSLYDYFYEDGNDDFDELRKRLLLVINNNFNLIFRYSNNKLYLTNNFLSVINSNF